MNLAVQRSFDDLGTPLCDVTFCIIDIETTGGRADDGGITEIGALKVRGGECLGTFATLVNPGRAIPTSITVLTGITEAMVLPAPRIESVLASLIEFVGDAVIVGHNIRYDLGFLNAALERSGRPRFTNRTVDTCALARRLVRNEVPNCKLSTVASRLRLDHQPSHRALDDVLATTDLLHLLLERVASLGVTGLDDLLVLPKLAGHPQAAKLRLTNHLPRAPGVYLFRDGDGRVLYVGKATNLRTRVRSYFSGDSRRKIGTLLREARRIDHIECAHPLEAAVVEVRLIHEHQPRFNRQSKDWSRYVYLKLTLHEPFPRFSVVKAVRDDGAFYLGPLPSNASARRVAEAVETVLPLRRCAGRVQPGRARRDGVCTAAQLGVALCPCTGEVTPEAYAAVVADVVRSLTTDPALVLDPLAERMAALAAGQRFEEAADVRERAAAFAHAVRRQRRLESLRNAGHLDLRIGDHLVHLERGRMTTVTAGTLPFASDLAPVPAEGPIPRDVADELWCVASWLDHRGASAVVQACDGEFTSALPAIPSFTPRRAA
jgi:DNA polymerase-3 subunit epsilon